MGDSGKNVSDFRDSEEPPNWQIDAHRSIRGVLIAVSIATLFWMALFLIIRALR